MDTDTSTTTASAPTSPAAPPLIRGANLCRSFEMGSATVEVLHDVSLEVLAGEKVFLCGASGAGKTTLMYTLAGLERPLSGEVFFDGESIYRAPKNRQAAIRNARMGYIFQNYFLMPELTALENVLLPAFMVAGDKRDRGAEILGRLGLSERLDHRPSELSGGEQQRVAIARSLINDPDVIFADEPTGNLDSKTGAGVMDALIELVAEKKKSLIVVTHDTKLARLGDRTLELADGRLIH
ncbi:MAG: ABC-type lipoprotein export system ATPase subunit [Pseudoalteromonas tetraodonis]|jgi:ABC-type lipoprotein export system ATPase subunit